MSKKDYTVQLGFEHYIQMFQEYWSNPSGGSFGRRDLELTIELADNLELETVDELRDLLDFWNETHEAKLKQKRDEAAALKTEAAKTEEASPE